ncbi:hypothetical protein B0H11DRAFT_2210361 [Mycena galericulata]|nr:hypothetical protein B0H11DRAFT_2210361 [Mycena galericulata]
MTAQDLETGPRPKAERIRWPRVVSWVNRWLPVLSGQEKKSANSPKNDGKESSRYSETENDEACERLWGIYAAEAERYDTALVESWKGDMEGMLIFSGLFSASVTSFLIQSYQSLTPDSGNLTVELLMKISQQLAGGGTPTLPIPTFQVPTWSIICNTLWFASLTLSLSCALLATLVEQWAREFLHKTEMRPSPGRHARLLSFLYLGVERFGMPAIVEVLPLLLHVSLLFFFAGLVVFLVPVNEVVTGLVGGILGLFVLLYSILTVLPIIALDCPYRTPLSGVVWSLLERFHNFSRVSTINAPIATLAQAVVKHAFKEPNYRDERAILWTLENLTDDNEFLPFVEAIPDVVFGRKGFRQVNDHLFGAVLSTTDQHTSLGHRLTNLLRDAEGMPDLEPLKLRKQLTSLKAIWALCTAASRLPSSSKGHPFLMWLAETNAFLNRFQNLPPGLQISCSAVIVDTLSSSMKSWVGETHQVLSHISIQRGSPSAIHNVHSSIMALRSLLTDPSMVSISDHLIPLGQLKDVTSVPKRRDRNVWIADTVAVASLVHDDPLWIIAKIQNTSRMLQNSFNSGTIPYNLEMTCHHIFPELHSPGWNTILQGLLTHERVASRPALNNMAVWVMLPAYQSEQSPWQQQVAAPSFTNLDYMMRMVLRLLPFLHIESTLPFIYWYFANRTMIPIQFQDSFEPRTSCNFLENADKVFLETKFIESMWATDTPAGTLEAVAAYYMQGINSDETVERMYIATVAKVQILNTRTLDAPPSLNMSVKAILTRRLWGRLRSEVHKISTYAPHRDMDRETLRQLLKIIEHPFLAGRDPDIRRMDIRRACSLLQRNLDSAYTTTLDEIIAFCNGDGSRAFEQVVALRTMSTLPPQIALSTDHQPQYVKAILGIFVCIKRTPVELGLYRSSVLTLLPLLAKPGSGNAVTVSGLVLPAGDRVVNKDV